MGLIEDIKKDTGAPIFTKGREKELEFEKKLNAMFYLEKDPDAEIDFLKMVMTRGQETAERKGLHCSAIIGAYSPFCLRCQVLSLIYKQSQGSDVPVNLKRIFSEGDAIHEKWQRLFIRAGYCDPYDCDKTQYCEEYDLQYTPDIICEIDGVKMVGELKSMGTYPYRDMIAKDGHHESGKSQLFMYMFLTGIHKGFVLCEDKNTQDFYVRLYDYDQSEIKEYLDRLEKIKKAKSRLMSESKLVKRHEKCVSYDCDMAKKCVMRETCWGKRKERIENFELTNFCEFDKYAEKSYCAIHGVKKN